MRRYKKIEFAEGITMSFAEFKKTFGSNWVFGKLSKQQKEKELKKAYKIATNGNNTRSPKTSKKVDTEQPREELI